MKSTSVIGLLLILVVVPGVAIYAGSQAKSGGSKTVTGCLQKGDEPNEYSITDANGKTYGLYSSDVKLADHVGHKVTVIGQMKAEKETEEREEKGSNRKEVGDLQVTKLTMVSTSCQ